MEMNGGGGASLLISWEDIFQHSLISILSLSIYYFVILVYKIWIQLFLNHVGGEELSTFKETENHMGSGHVAYY